MTCILHSIIIWNFTDNIFKTGAEALRTGRQQNEWSTYKSCADIGTAQGDLAVQIALANPHLEKMGLDLAEVRPIFEDYAEASGVTKRLRFQAGNFFTEALPAVDALLVGHILHD